MKYSQHTAYYIFFKIPTCIPSETMLHFISHIFRISFISPVISLCVKSGSRLRTVIPSLYRPFSSSTHHSPFVSLAKGRQTIPRRQKCKQSPTPQYSTNAFTAGRKVFNFLHFRLRPYIQSGQTTINIRNTIKLQQNHDTVDYPNLMLLSEPNILDFMSNVRSDF